LRNNICLLFFEFDAKTLMVAKQKAIFIREKQRDAMAISEYG